MQLTLRNHPSPLQSLCAAVLVAVAALSAVPLASAQTYDKCGDIVPGVTCPRLFLDDDGDLWLLEDFGGFQVGDRVRVTSDTIDPGCLNICNQGNGCIFANTIADCLPTGTPFCFGDGSGTPCPCLNPGDPGHGCANQPGSPGGLLNASGSASVSAADLVLHGSDLVPNQFGLFFQGTAQRNGGLGTPLGDGLLCVDGSVIRLEVVPIDSSGGTSSTIDLASAGNISAGDVRNYQLWYRNTPVSPCGVTNNLTNGLEITWVP